MKKRKVIGTFILSAALSISMFAPTAFGETATKEETFRVHIDGPSTERAKSKKDHKARWDFGTDGYTTTVNAKQYQALKKNKKLNVTVVEEVKLDTRVEADKADAGILAVPSQQVPWGVQAVYNSSATPSGGDGIKVAVLDTGVNTAHVDLAGNVEQCKDFTQSSSQVVNGSCADRNGHGTHVAGTALANGGADKLGIYGVAPQAELWAYKVLTDSGSGYSDDIAAAIRHAADQASSLGQKVIVSMSLGSSGKDSLISSAVDYAYGKGVLVVAAAGNSGPSSNTIGYPGALVNAVAVASLDNAIVNGTHRVSSFSSRGNPSTDGDYVIQEKDIEVSAPGGSIYSTATNGGYTTMSGTSMATPHISGLAAKLWSSNKSWTNRQLRTALQNKAKLYDIKGGTGAAAGDDYASGFGFPRVN